MRCYLCSILSSSPMYRKLQIIFTPFRYALKMLGNFYRNFLRANLQCLGVIFCKKTELIKNRKLITMKILLKSLGKNVSIQRIKENKQLKHTHHIDT